MDSNKLDNRNCDCRISQF